MAGIFDRLEKIILSYMREDERTLFGSPRWDDVRGGEDFQDAWRELDEYLNGPRSARFGRAEPLRGEGRRSGARTGPFQETFQGPFGTPPPERDETLRQDYANLEVPFRADLSEVKRGYKLLLQTYHPDRFARDPEKTRSATEVTKKLNASFRRIKRFQETGTLQD